MLSPTAGVQATRGSGVATGTGRFTSTMTDLQMPGLGEPFQATRTYSSANATAGTLGMGWAWTYDAQVIPPTGGRTAVTVRAEDGAQATYPRNPDGTYARPPGAWSTLSTAADGGWRLVTPAQITYAFDATGRLTSIKNPRGFGTTVAYTPTRWTIQDWPGRRVVCDLGSDGLVRRITLPDGRYVRYQYRNGLLSGVTDAAGATWTYSYTAGLLTTVTDPQGRAQVTNSYQAGRVATQTDAAGASTSFAWDPAKQEATTVDADGVRFFDGYRGNVLIYTQNGNGDSVNHRYDPTIDPNLLVDAKGNQTTSAYDGAGNVTSVTAPEPFSYTIYNTYDPHNNLITHTDGSGRAATFGYTAFDELQSITERGGELTVLTIDDRGLITSAADPRGKVTHFDYDAAGNETAITTPLGEKTAFAYDGTGRPVASTDPRGNLPGADPAEFTTRFSYDNLDRLRKTFDPGKQHAWEIVYDNLGQLIETENPT